jgi:hypothetical protein
MYLIVTSSNRSDAGMLQGIVEHDEKYIGGTPQPKFCGVHIISHYRYAFFVNHALFQHS